MNITAVEANAEDIIISTIPAELEDVGDRMLVAHTRIVAGVEGMFDMGHLVNRAHELLPTTQAYGAWFRGRSFPFSIRSAHNYASMADHEERMRELMARSEKLAGRSIGAHEALKVARAEGTNGITSRAPARSIPKRSVPGRYLPLLVADANVALNDLDSLDRTIRLPEKLKLRKALNEDIDRDEDAMGVTVMRKAGGAA